MGNGAIILREPDAPFGLADDTIITSMYQAGMYWYQGYEDGGTPVLDYRVWYTIEGGTFTILEETVTDTTYIATSLTTGTNYEFKVQARNAYGYSDYSNVALILAASVPSKPVAPVTTWSDANDQVTITWTEPPINGAAVLSYTIYI